MNNELSPLPIDITIGQSVKIGKQVIRKQLEAKIEELVEKLTPLQETHDKKRRTWRNAAEKEIDRIVNDEVANDDELNTLRILYNKFSRFDKLSDYPPFKDNKDMVEHIRTDWVFSSLESKESKMRMAFLVSEPIEVAVNLRIPDRNVNESWIDSLGFNYEIILPDFLKELFHDYNDVLRELDALTDERIALKQKLGNLDNLAEEMEAQLLVQELQKSDAGNAALAITANLVTEMLGDTPALLAQSENLNAFEKT